MQLDGGGGGGGGGGDRLCLRGTPYHDISNPGDLPMAMYVLPAKVGLLSNLTSLVGDKTS